MIVKKLLILPTLIGKVGPVYPGFAISSCNTEARETILTAVNDLFISGAGLDEASNWISVIILTAPS